MILVDSHAHLHFPDYASDLPATLERARERGVRYLVNVGTNFKCSHGALSLAEEHGDIFATVGCHPHDAKDFLDADYWEYRRLAQHPKVVAVGEIGLDFFRNLSPPDIQEKVFRKFLGLSRETGLPLVLHVRDAHREIFRILREEIGPSVRGVLHCFSGDESVLEEALSLGLWISFACNITYKKNDFLRKLIACVPRHKILLETDSPFLPPEGFRGKRNEPAYIVEGASLAARMMGIPLEELAERTTENAREFFQLPAGNREILS